MKCYSRCDAPTEAEWAVLTVNTPVSSQTEEIQRTLALVGCSSAARAPLSAMFSLLKHALAQMRCRGSQVSHPQGFGFVAACFVANVHSLIT